MTSISHAAAERQIAQSETLVEAPAMRGRVCEFTRHPKQLARVPKIGLRACAARVLAALLTFADREGLCWVKPRQLQRVVRRSSTSGHGERRVFGETYSLPSILRALRELQGAGLLAWERVSPLGRFPARPERNGPAVMGEGEFTTSGGRVFRLALERLRDLAAKAPATRGTRRAGKITSDPGSPITRDLPSDPSPLGACVTGSRAPARPRPVAPSALVRQERPQVAPPGGGAGAGKPARAASETPTEQRPELGQVRALTSAIARPSAPSAPRTGEHKPGQVAGDGRGGEELVRLTKSDWFAWETSPAPPPIRRA